MSVDKSSAVKESRTEVITQCVLSWTHRGEGGEFTSITKSRMYVYQSVWFLYLLKLFSFKQQEGRISWFTDGGRAVGALCEMPLQAQERTAVVRLLRSVASRPDDIVACWAVGGLATFASSRCLQSALRWQAPYWTPTDRSERECCIERTGSVIIHVLANSMSGIIKLKA